MRNVSFTLCLGLFCAVKVQLGWDEPQEQVVVGLGLVAGLGQP